MLAFKVLVSGFSEALPLTDGFGKPPMKRFSLLLTVSNSPPAAYSPFSKSVPFQCRFHTVTVRA